jgi:hypothetical protein
MDRQYNDQQKKDKETNNGRQKTTQKTKDWVIWTPQKTCINSAVLEVQAVPVPLVASVM